MRSERAEFPKSVKETIWLRANGCCELCHQPFGQRRPHYDHHPIAAALGGPGTADNGRALCPPCHRQVTKEEDLPRITKAKAIEEKRAGLRRPKQKFGWRKAG